MRKSLTLRLFGPQNIAKTGDDRPAKSLYGFVWRMSGWRQFVASGLAISVALLAMAPLELQRLIVDDVIVDRNFEMLIWLGAIYLAAIILQQVLKFIMRVYRGWIGESATRFAREHLSSIYRRRKATPESGTAVTVISTEIDQLGAFVGQAIAEPLVQGGVLVVIYGYMLAVQPEIALLSAMFFLPQLIVVPWMQSLINSHVDRRVGMLRRLGDRVSEDEFEEPDGHRWKHHLRRLDLIHYNRMRIFVLKHTSKAVVNTLNHLAPLSVLMVGGWMVMEGQTTIGIVVAFIRGFERMADPLRDLIAFYRLAAIASVKHDRIAEWIEDHLDNAERPKGEATA